MHNEYDEWAITAELASLELDELETERLAAEADRMLKLFLTMAKADVDGLEPTTHAQSGANRVRDDKVQIFDDTLNLLEASPEVEDDFFLIPNVL